MKKEREHTPMKRVLYGYPSPRTAIYPLKEIEYEGHMFPCPNDPDIRLKDTFGEDYMQLPPVKQRRIHAKFICPDASHCHLSL